MSLKPLARILAFTAWDIFFNHYKDNLLAQKDSSPGPDGVPFSAYKAIPDTAAAALMNLAGIFAASPPPLHP